MRQSRMTHLWGKYKTAAGAKPSKQVKSEEKSEVPIPIQDYAAYESFLPSPRVLNDHKQILAIEHEKEAATVLNKLSLR